MSDESVHVGPGPTAVRDVPKVSVVVPAYNVEAYVGDAVASALRQTEARIEIIIVDDGSTDRTREVVRAIRDPRVKLLVNDRNLGPATSRNRAIAAAVGDWIAWLDADDWWSPQRLERLLSVAATHPVEMVADDVALVEDGARRPWGTHLTRSPFRSAFRQVRSVSAPDFVTMNLSQLQPIIRRTFLHEQAICFDERFRRVEDFHLYVECLLAGARFVLLPEAHYFYRTRSGSLTTQRGRLYESFRAATNTFLDDPRVLRDRALMFALMSQRAWTEEMIHYSHFLEAVTGGRVLAAARDAVRRPWVVWRFVQRIPMMARKRMSRYW